MEKHAAIRIVSVIVVPIHKCTRSSACKLKHVHAHYTGNINLTYENDDANNLNFFLNGSQIPVSFTLVNGTGATQSYFQLQMTKCLFVDGWAVNIMGGKGYVEVGGPVTAVANTSDANTAGGGYSPSRSVLKNTLATGTFQ